MPWWVSVLSVLSVLSLFGSASSSSLVRIPFLQSDLITSSPQWPNYAGARCVATMDDEAYVLTSTYHYSHGAYACTHPPRRVEILRVNTTRAREPVPPPLTLYAAAGCNGSGFEVPGDWSGCAAGGGVVVSYKSVSIVSGQRATLHSTCGGSGPPILSVGPGPACVEIPPPQRAMIRAVRFLTRPHPAVTGRVVVGGPYWDTTLGQAAVGDKGSDNVVACGVAGEAAGGPVLFYVASNLYRCPTGTPASMVRLRITPSPVHTDGDIGRLIDALSEIWSQCELARMDAVA